MISIISCDFIKVSSFSANLIPRKIVMKIAPSITFSLNLRTPDSWSNDEHALFIHIGNQYATISKNKRKLFIDRMKREIPKKSKQEVVSLFNVSLFKEC